MSLRPKIRPRADSLRSDRHQGAKPVARRSAGAALEFGGYAVSQELTFIWEASWRRRTVETCATKRRKFGGKNSVIKSICQNDDVRNSCRPNLANGYLNISIFCSSVCS